MKKINKIIATACLSLGLCSSDAMADWVNCGNCSDLFTQLLGYIQDESQLQTVISNYEESIRQTANQIEQIQNQVRQYENMLKNTKQLSPNILYEMRGTFTRLANLHGRLQTYRGDMGALGQIFSKVYPELDSLNDLAAASGDAVGPANQKYQEHWKAWTDNLNTAHQETFKLTGEQLRELSGDELETHIGQLLETPEGQMEAAMAGNKLASLQIQETRELRGLMATSIQAQVQKDMKTEKKEEMTHEMWKELTKTDKLKGATGRNRPPDPGGI